MDEKKRGVNYVQKFAKYSFFFHSHVFYTHTSSNEEYSSHGSTSLD